MSMLLMPPPPPPTTANHRQIHPALTKHKRKVVGPVGNKETLPDHAVVCPLVMPVVSNTGRDACPVN